MEFLLGTTYRVTGLPVGSKPGAEIETFDKLVYQGQMTWWRPDYEKDSETRQEVFRVPDSFQHVLFRLDGIMEAEQLSPT